jgi:hypothetical protein
MKESDIQELIKTNQRLLFLIGYASSFLFECAEYVDKEKHEWFNEAVEATVYQDERWPEVP